MEVVKLTAAVNIDVIQHSSLTVHFFYHLIKLCNDHFKHFTYFFAFDVFNILIFLIYCKNSSFDLRFPFIRVDIFLWFLSNEGSNKKTATCSGKSKSYEAPKWWKQHFSLKKKKDNPGTTRTEEQQGWRAKSFPLKEGKVCMDYFR